MAKFQGIEIGAAEIKAAFKGVGDLLNSRIGLALLVGLLVYFYVLPDIRTIRDNSNRMAQVGGETYQTVSGNHDMLIQLATRCDVMPKPDIRGLQTASRK